MLNTRMKDFFDLWVLAKHSDFDGSVLFRAVAATFSRRKTAIPQGVPIGLSNEFINDVQKEKQWQGFLRKNALDPVALTTVISQLREFLLPVLVAISVQIEYNRIWCKGEGWCDVQTSDKVTT